MLSDPLSHRRCLRLSASLLLSCLMLFSYALCSAAEAPAQADERSGQVRLQLRWYHQFQFAGYYAAIEQGYYRDAGMEVELIEGGAGKDTITEVLNGNADFGVTNAEVLLHRLHGKPLVAIAAIFQHSPLVFVSRRETGVFVPQDFAGKFVKMSRTGRDIELQAMLHREDVSFDELILLEDVATSDDYLDPNIDVLAAYITNQPYYLKQKNIPYTIISPATYGIDFYGDCLFTIEALASNEPARVAAFRDATVKGWQYALSHKEEMIDLILGKYKSKKSRDHLNYEAMEIEKLVLAELVEIGHMNPGRWEHIAKVFQELKLIPEHYSLDGFLFVDHPETFPQWLVQALFGLGAFAIFGALGSLFLLLFNRRLQREINIRKNTELALQHSERTLQNYSKQIEQFSLSAAAMLSIRDEKVLFTEMSRAITELSDFKRVLILLFKDEPPFRELIGSAGISEEILAKIRKTNLPRGWYDDIFSLGIKLGQMSFYVPHTMKSMLNQEAVFYGEGPIPEKENMWHPSDNLFVRMNNEHGDLIGVISVDTSKSGAKPTDEVVRPLEVYASLISQIIILNREHTRRQQLEQKLRFSQKLEALGNLTGGIAHDFNNILGVVIGNTELALLDTPGNSSTRHNLNEIRSACYRARDIVQQLLLFNRKSDQQLHPVSVSALLRDSLRFLKTMIPPGIELTVQLNTGNERILADPPQMYQALLNLFSNGVQAMEESGGRLTISATSLFLQAPQKSATGDIPPGRYVRLSISDTGHGIPSHLLERIFDPYYTTRKFGKGAGMGLSTVHGIIQSHNGAIQVHSIAGEGATFSIFLPVIDAETPEAFADSSLQTGSETILLVDDELSLLEVSSRVLQKLGYQVIAKNDPQKALDLLRQDPEQVQLLITDMTMPGMSGSELAEKALELRADLPIILCTGYSDRIDERQATRIGISRYIEKPVDQARLSSAIRSVLHDRPHA